MIKIINEFFRVLWLSVSSADFYSDLYNKYKGYGLKYITMIISLTSIVYAILFMYNLISIKNYLEQITIHEGAGQETNPVAFMLKDWPSLQYDGQIITSEDPTPVYITTLAGIKVAAIDPAGNLTKDQMQKVSLIFAKDKAILWLSSNNKGDKQELNSIVLTYDKIFGTEPLTINHDFIASYMLNTLKQIGPLAFCIAIPILMILRVIIHISRNLFSIILLFGIFWWTKKKPTASSVTRIVFFSSGVPEVITPLILIIYPPLLPITIFVEYWAVMLAMYAIARKQK